MKSLFGWLILLASTLSTPCAANAADITGRAVEGADHSSTTEVYQ